MGYEANVCAVAVWQLTYFAALWVELLTTKTDKRAVETNIRSCVKFN